MAISILEEAKNNTKYAMETTVINTNSFTDDANFEHRVLINRQKWEGWISDAIQHSKNRNTTVLIIDKQEHTCFVIDNGTLVQDLLIEMGVNHLNDKNRKNDYATPEGSYYISSKKEGAESNNHKTILLNFPNNEDKVRFEKAFQNKEITDLDVLTYKLSIHGNGGKGYNWTDGSIALSNKNVDILYSKVKIGSRVVIVGATDEILTVSDN
jgi:murein L,D-transpeptidase YafK